MAKPEARITIHLEPSDETVLMSKRMLELWLNADSRRDIRVKERCTGDGTEVYLDLVGEPDDT